MYLVIILTEFELEDVAYQTVLQNTVNNLGEKDFFPVRSQIIITSRVNKDYTIQFSIKSRKGKVPNR